MKHTGVFATPEEILIAHDSLQGPALMAGRLPQFPGGLVYSMALKHGLPEIHGTYGILPSGEFICADSEGPKEWRVTPDPMIR
jgi:hypothetical protein